MKQNFKYSLIITVADPGFPVRGRRGPPIRALFGENVCENKRIGSRRGRTPGTPPRSANDMAQF